MARTYATSAQYVAYTGQAAPTDIDARLASASRFLDSQVFRMCSYEVVEATGLPSNALVIQAFADAACAQVKWGIDVGDTTGAAAVGWGTVEIGSAKLSRSVTAVSGDDAPGRQIAPEVWDALRSPDLTPDVFQLGAVCS
ncbi:hypothetical protein ACFYW6_07005 [Streptomyces sp. NPDC002659]|uniref:hypothetical protein n=1 Tax=Streptomyces sp. NPDC002659 TaxID=3364656 RepID=UPI00369D886A